MNIITIKQNNIELLKYFVDNMGNSVKTFRYFQKRPLNCIKNHLITYIFLENNEPVAYGHLDADNGDIWLGVCVKENKQKQGLGHKMISELINFAKNNKIYLLNLSVDDNNLNAIKLYKKMGFVEKENKNGIIFMILNI